MSTDLNNVSDFFKATNVIFKIISDIADGPMTNTKTLRSTFVGTYNKACERSKEGYKYIICGGATSFEQTCEVL